LHNGSTDELIELTLRRMNCGTDPYFAASYTTKRLIVVSRRLPPLRHRRIISQLLEEESR